MENIKENKEYIKMKNKKNTWLAIAIGLIVISLYLLGSVSMWQESSQEYCELSNELIDTINVASEMMDIDTQLNKFTDCSYAVAGEYEE